MTWRRFDTLLNNLSVESNTVLLMQNDRENSKPEMKELTQDEFVALLGT
jgi:hypothetical protein